MNDEIEKLANELFDKVGIPHTPSAILQLGSIRNAIREAMSIAYADAAKRCRETNWDTVANELQAKADELRGKR